MEAAPGFEPGIRALQAPALPLGHAAGNWRGAGAGAFGSIWVTRPLLRVKPAPQLEFWQAQRNPVDLQRGPFARVLHGVEEFGLGGEPKASE